MSADENDLLSRPKRSAVEGPAVASNLKQNCHPDPERSEGEGSAVPAISSPEQLTARERHPLTQLRQFTPARIAIGRTGSSLPTKELLEFSVAHATARDAVHTRFDAQSLSEQLAATKLQSIKIHSAAPDRTIYLRRPDLGRKLDDTSRTRLAELKLPTKPELVFIIADGLSAIAPERYAVPLIKATLGLIKEWKIGPIVVAEQARVALGDEIGELLEAEITVILIGERPGLRAPDSLGIYLTYAPKPGRTDAERNCISNVRDEGTSPQQAAQTLHYLLTSSRRLKLSGVRLKDESALGL